jgi:hypothetical protein
MNIIGDVEGKTVIFFDDVISTGRTLCQAAEAMRANGAREIYAGATHACLADGAAERLAASPDSRGRDHRHHSAPRRGPERQVHGPVRRGAPGRGRSAAFTKSDHSARSSSDNRNPNGPRAA